MPHRPTYSLRKVVKILGNEKTLSVTGVALKAAFRLGYTHSNIAEVMTMIEPSMFYKTMPSYDNADVMQDVYHVPHGSYILYIKFREDEITEFHLLSFKKL